jgi:ADP-heptose:LPS heptosyltransferase
MRLSIPGLRFITATVPLKFHTDGHTTVFKPGAARPISPEQVLVLTSIHVQMFGLRSGNGISVSDAVVIPDDCKIPQIYDGTQDLSGRSILILMLNGWGDTILIQPALRAFYENAVASGDPPKVTLGCNWIHNFPYPGSAYIHEVRANILTLKQLGEFDLLVNLIPANHQRSLTKSMKDLYGETMCLKNKDVAASSPSIDTKPARVKKIRPVLERIRRKTGKKLLYVNWKSRFSHKNARPLLFFGIVERLSNRYQAVLFKDASTAKIMQQEIDAAASPIENLSYLIGDYHDTVAALSMVDAFISVDTGVVHAAGALGLRGVALFGPFPPETHVSDYASVVGIRAPYKGKTCKGPCLETHRGCSEVGFSSTMVSPCFDTIDIDFVINAFKRTV